MRKWRVQFLHPVTKRKLHAGCFDTREEAEAKAKAVFQELWEKHHRVVPVKKFAELQHFEPLGTQAGVKWSVGEQCWRAQCFYSGRQRNMRFTPKDLTETEVKKSWEQAVSWRQKQEQERAKSMSTKAEKIVMQQTAAAWFVMKSFV